jgi:predicted RNase H-like HicB family nuclease
LVPPIERLPIARDHREESLINVREAIELYLETLTEEERCAALSREILTTAVEING